MKVSLIIPTLNAEKLLAPLILSLREQALLVSEIIVIDSSSDDRTVEIAANLGCRTIVIDRKNFDHGGTRNLAAKESTGEVIVFMTQDALPVDSRFIENLITPLEDKSIAASFGRQVPRLEANPPEKFARLFNYPETPAVKSDKDLSRLAIKTFFFSNVCSAVNRSDFLEVGGFSERAIMNEDMLLAARLILSGRKVAYTPSAAVWHSHDYTLSQQFNRYFDIGASLNMNKWVLEYITAESEGYRFTREQIKYLISEGHYRWLPNVIGLTLAKYAGYRLGLSQEKLPLWFKKRVSLNKNFWTSTVI